MSSDAQANKVQAAANRQHHVLLAALRQYAETGLGIFNCVAFRIGRGIKSLCSLNGYESSVFQYWTSSSMDQHYLVVSSSGTAVPDVKLIAGADWQSCRFVQYLCIADEDAQAVVKASLLDSRGDKPVAESPKAITPSRTREGKVRSHDQT